MTEILSNDAISTINETFNFTVDKFPLFGPDNMKTDQYGLFRSDVGYLSGVKSISDRYVPHTTDDVVALCEAARHAFDCEIDLECHFRNGHYVSIAPTDGFRRSIYNGRDNIWPRFVVSGGFDGKGFKAILGYYRDACKNLSWMRKVSGLAVSIRHTSGLRVQMDNLVEQFSLLKNGWSTLTDIIEQMESHEVRMTDFLNEVYGRPSDQDLALAESGRNIRGVTIHRDRTKEIFLRLEKERQKTGRPLHNGLQVVSAWEAYNAVQGWTQHQSTTRGKYNTDFDKILKAGSSTEVLRAEELALSA
jgi:hypothetical protein